jgi:hypothetical protein
MPMRALFVHTINARRVFLRSCLQGEHLPLTRTKKKFSFRSFLRFCNSIFIISFRSFRSLSLFLQSFAFRDKTSGKRLQTKQQVFAEQVTGVRGKRQKQQASADKTKQQVFADKFDLSFAI